MAETQKLAHVGSWEFDLKTGGGTFSAEAYNVFGVDPATFKPRFETVFALVHPEDQPALTKYLADYVASGAAASSGIDLRIIAADGTIKYVHESRRMLFDADGRPARILGLVQDITERRLTEERLQHASLVQKTLMDASPDGIMVADADRRIVMANRAFLAMWGVQPAELGADDHDPIRASMVAQMQDPEAYAARAEYLHEHPDLAGDDEIETKDGRIIQRFSMPLGLPGRGHVGRVRYFRDITERRAAEAKAAIRQPGSENPDRSLARRLFGGRCRPASDLVQPPFRRRRLVPCSAEMARNTSTPSIK